MSLAYKHFNSVAYNRLKPIYLRNVYKYFAGIEINLLTWNVACTVGNVGAVIVSDDDKIEIFVLLWE